MNSTQRAAVEAAIRRMTSAFAAGDIDAVLSTYEPQAVVVGEPGRPVTGEGPLRAMFEGFAAMAPHFTYGAEETVVSGDIALHLMPWSMTGKGADGTTSLHGGLSVAVLRRQPDGHWRMVIDHPFGDLALDRAPHP